MLPAALAWNMGTTQQKQLLLPKRDTFGAALARACKKWDLWLYSTPCTDTPTGTLYQNRCKHSARHAYVGCSPYQPHSAMC